MTMLKGTCKGVHIASDFCLQQRNRNGKTILPRIRVCEGDGVQLAEVLSQSNYAECVQAQAKPIALHCVVSLGQPLHVCDKGLQDKHSWSGWTVARVDTGSCSVQGTSCDQCTCRIERLIHHCDVVTTVHIWHS